MLVNVCTDLAGVSANCNCVSVSGSEPQNLVSSDPVLRSYGFRAERYVRGPVIASVDLSCLKVPFTIAAVVMRGALRENTSFLADVFIGDGGQERLIGRLPFGGLTHSDYSPVGSLIRTRDKPILDLASEVRGSYINEALILNKVSSSEDMQNTLFMRRTVKTLSVRITNLRGGISAGISWLEIWSECDSPPYVIPSSLPSLYPGTAIRNLYATPEDSTVCAKQLPVSSTETESIYTPLETPAEFIDQLTCEIMKNPVTLPSGNTVDMESIHKLMDQGLQSNTPPADPFTGLPLEHFIPVINVILRDRINRFELSKQESNGNGYSQLKVYGNRDTSDSTELEPSKSIPEVDLEEIRKKRISHFQSNAYLSKKPKTEYRPHRELLFSTQLPFDSPVTKQKPKYETIDLTLSGDS